MAPRSMQRQSADANPLTNDERAYDLHCAGQTAAAAAARVGDRFALLASSGTHTAESAAGCAGIALCRPISHDQSTAPAQRFTTDLVAAPATRNRPR
jgi:hypothetical protein